MVFRALMLLFGFLLGCCSTNALWVEKSVDRFGLLALSGLWVVCCWVVEYLAHDKDLNPEADK